MTWPWVGLILGVLALIVVDTHLANWFRERRRKESHARSDRP